jgi:hypothetical protein
MRKDHPMAIGLRRLLPLAGPLVVGLGVTAASAQDAVTTGAVNMRAGPGTQYERITTLPAGAPVDIADCTGSWCRVVYRGVTGYVARSLLDEDGGVVEAPPRVYVEPPPVYVEPPYFYGSPGYYAPYRPGLSPSLSPRSPRLASPDAARQARLRPARQARSRTGLGRRRPSSRIGHRWCRPAGHGIARRWTAPRHGLARWWPAPRLWLGWRWTASGCRHGRRWTPPRGRHGRRPPRWRPGPSGPELIKRLGASRRRAQARRLAFWPTSPARRGARRAPRRHPAKIRRIQAMTAGREITFSRMAAAKRP